MADPREFDENGDVTSGYLSPQEARDAGVEWKGRPGESDDLSSDEHYQTPDEAQALGKAWAPVVGNYDYQNGGSQAQRRIPVLPGQEDAAQQAWTRYEASGQRGVEDADTGAQSINDIIAELLKQGRG